MIKGLFFSLPSVSVDKTLAPVIEEMTRSGCHMIYYNAARACPGGKPAFQFKAYPESFDDRYAEKINEGISYFQFGEILVEAASSLIDFLKEEIEREKPDFILHSHLAVWGKLAARYFQLPQVTLFTTFILDQRIMLPFFRRMHATGVSGLTHVQEAIGFYRKCEELYLKLGLKTKPDIWDVYINKGDLNLSFILSQFQPRKELLGPEYSFVGPPLPLPAVRTKKPMVYVSMGTLLNKDVSFYRLCIEVLKDLQLESLVSVGSPQILAQLGTTPAHIKTVAFTDQFEVLQRTMIFISRGGMASIHEAIYCRTPMVVIPSIPEQQLNAERVASLQVGLHLPLESVDYESLRSAILQVIDHYPDFIKSLNALRKEIPLHPPEKRAAMLIQNYLKTSSFN